jgi:hypothetical protein
LFCIHLHSSTTGSSKGGHAPCVTAHVGRRGKPVLRQRFIPAEKAFAYARKLQCSATIRSSLKNPATPAKMGQLLG